jgi:murein DD-endopeptidase MepM/ murein hydrolase activator NlpD
MHLSPRLTLPLRGLLSACGLAAVMAATVQAQTPGTLFKGSLLPSFDRVRSVVSKRLEIPVQGVTMDRLRDSYLEGRSGGRTHHAIDIHAPLNTPVVAVTDGVILKLHVSNLGGNSIYHLDDDGRTRYYYAHLDHYAEGLHEGQRVQKGDVIGYVGDTGNAAPGDYHLHFAVGFLSSMSRWWDARTVDPFYLLRDGTARLESDPDPTGPAAAPVRLAAVAVERPRRERNERAATRPLTATERAAAFARLEREERAALHRCNEVTGRTRARCREAVGDRFVAARAAVGTRRAESGTCAATPSRSTTRHASSTRSSSRSTSRKSRPAAASPCATRESSSSRPKGESARSRRESASSERSGTRRSPESTAKRSSTSSTRRARSEESPSRSRVSEGRTATRKSSTAEHRSTSASRSTSERRSTSEHRSTAKRSESRSSEHSSARSSSARRSAETGRSTTSKQRSSGTTSRRTGPSSSSREHATTRTPARNRKAE